MAAWTKFAETPPVAPLNRAIATAGLEPGGEHTPQKVRRRRFIGKRRPACALYVVPRGAEKLIRSRWIEKHGRRV